jgi:hypothetical protein
LKKILNISVFLFIIQVITFVNVSAASVTVTNDAGAEFINGDTVCSNRSYFLETESSYNEIVIVDAQTHMVLKVFSSNSDVSEIYFPENASDVEIYVTPYNDEHLLEFSKESKISLNVEPCGYEQLEDNDDYSSNPPLASVSYADSMISISAPTDVEDYEFDYQFLGEKTKRLKVNGQVPVEDNYIFQFKETYTQNGQTIEKYYELEINPTTNSYYVRTVDSFEIKTIKALDIINKKMTVLLLLLLVALIYIRAQLKREKKKLNKEKDESRRR